MHPLEVKNQLETLVLLADTREQPTKRAARRLEQIGLPVERVALSFGDYSVKCDSLDLREKVCIERKMSLEELSGCFFQGRDRFSREFKRAQDVGAKLYLLIENASLDDLYTGRYRTKATPKSFAASLNAWQARYNCQVIFCNEAISGLVIHDVLYREIKERLEAL